MRDAITQAGLPPDCKHHGLHKAAGRMLAEARATSKMIMAVLGHMTPAAKRQSKLGLPSKPQSSSRHIGNPGNSRALRGTLNINCKLFEPPTKTLVIAKKKSNSAQIVRASSRPTTYAGISDEA
jgi:hypothetical protein